jgi:hypothetical protein
MRAEIAKIQSIEAMTERVARLERQARSYEVAQIRERAVILESARVRAGRVVP